MYFPESFAQAIAHGDSAMKRMHEIELPPTPNNYTIWYVYHSGSAPELKRDIDKLVGDNQPSSPSAVTSRRQPLSVSG